MPKAAIIQQLSFFFLLFSAQNCSFGFFLLYLPRLCVDINGMSKAGMKFEIATFFNAWRP